MTLPDDVIAYLREQVGEVQYFGRDPARVLLDKYAPEPKWHPGDVVRLNSGCTAMRFYQGGVWVCSDPGHPQLDDEHVTGDAPVLLVRDGKPVQP